MRKMRLRAAGAAAAMLLLAACDGGGGGTMTTPPPTGSTPTPSSSTPAPTPNTVLSALVSDGDLPTIAGEAAVVGTARTADFATLGLRYTAASQGYGVTVGTRTQIFVPADIDAAPSLPGLVAYTKVSGDTADSFMRLRPAAAAAVPTYYVGGGAWARQPVDAATTTPVLADAFTYGFATAAGAVPATGTRRYALDALTLDITAPFLVPEGGQVLRRIGEGELTVDFAARTVTLRFARHSPVAIDRSSQDLPLAVQTITGTGTLAADGSVTGSFDCNCTGSPALTPFRGKLYGPAAEEIGLTFAGGATATAGAGTVIGHQRAAFAQDVIDTGYSSLETSPNAGLSWRLGGTTFEFATASLTAGNRFSTTTDRYHLTSSYNAPATLGFYRENPFSLATPIAAESSPSYSTYGYAAPASAAAPAADQRLYLYNATALDSSLVVRAVKLGRLERRDSTQRHWDIFFASGTETPAAAIPATGTGRYIGVLAGLYFNADLPNTSPRTDYYTVSGVPDVTIDFAARSVTGTVRIVARRVRDGATLDLGTLPIRSGGTIDASGTIAARLEASATSGFVTGAIRGRLYGANGSEIGLAFEYISCGQCIGPNIPYNQLVAAGIGARR